jgi:transcriptional regulator with XRE-family HTH domain
MRESMPDHDPQAHSELASFGEELQREREIRGISLKEIADSTKISKRFLEAIERNDHKTLPAPVFTRGFVREYARYLGLNADEMVSRYNYGAAGDDRIEKTQHLDRLVQPPPAAIERPDPVKRGIPAPYARVDRNVYMVIVLVILLMGAAYWAVRHKREVAAAEARAELTATAAKPSTGHVIPVAPAPAPASATPAVDGSLLRLTMELTGDSWVSLEADGRTVLNDDLKRGERRAFEAREGFRFKTIGNAGGVELTLNDVKIPPLGDEGKVLHNRVFDRAYLQNRQAEPRSTP